MDRTFFMNNEGGIEMDNDPFVGEIKAAMRKLQNNRTSRENAILVELCKAAGGVFIH